MEQEMENMCDIHCHAVPGVDDGAASMKEALDILRKEYRDGVRTVILTPHFRKAMFETDRSRVRRQYELLSAEAERELPGFRLYLGCEFHVNMDLLDLLDENEDFRIAGSCHVLLEFSGGDSGEYIADRLYQAVAGGYEPIVAHAERYPVLWEDLHLVERLLRMGARIQVNAGSILGYYGKRIQKFCRRLMKEDFLSYVGSDAHNVSDRPPRMGECAAWLEKKMGRDYAERILVRNPAELLAGIPAAR